MDEPLLNPQAPFTPRDQEQALETYAPIDRLMRDSLELYCERLVKIQDKDGLLVPFRWNRAQRALHARLQRQLDEEGWVRAVVLKARQLGVSSYVCARYYHRSTMWDGQRTFILTQEDRATQNLFGMVRRVHDYMVPDFRPVLEVANANELKFEGMDGGYRVGTAQNVHGGGRSLTFNNFHGSEVAFWAQAQNHFSGVMQAVPQSRGTEVILESTANGVGGVFHEQWQLAIKGESGFVPIFFPWFWAEEYRQKVNPDLEFSAEELEYKRTFDLDDEQLTWMHYKSVELGGAPGEISAYFRQEYPATAQEAFQTTGVDSFIPATLIVQARNFKAGPQDFAPMVVGLDVARGGKSRTTFLDRQGFAMGRNVRVKMHTDDDVEIADRAAVMLNEFPIRMMFIDVTGGSGAGVYNILRRTFPQRVQGVNFGGHATDPMQFGNKRAEMAYRLKKWLMDPAGAEIPDDDEIHEHFSATPARHDFQSRLMMVEKRLVEKELGVSPDWFDSAIMTFAEELPNELNVKQKEQQQRLENMIQNYGPTNPATGWMAG